MLIGGTTADKTVSSADVPFESNMVVTFKNHVGAASQQLIPTARAIFIADVYRGDGKRYVVRADEMLAAFLQLESAIRAWTAPRS